MKIKELYIENFGKLSGYKKVFSDGLNAFSEDNGYGKTTLTVFIKTMLYGFDETRRQSLDENDRKKYTPWQGGAFGGYLVFEAKGKTYRIERSFQTKGSEDTFALYDLDTGRLSQDYSSSLGEELFGIDADGFERTVFLSEKNLSGKNTNQTISAKLSNLVGTEGDIGGFDAAIKLLDDRRRFYQKKGGAGEIQDIKREISELEDEIRRLYSKRENSSLTEAQIASIGDKIQLAKAKKEAILAKERKERLEKEKRGYEMQYADMLGALKVDEGREEELLRFFSDKLPTNAEIASASESASEIKRLTKTLDGIGENHELSSLKTFFAYEASSEECDRMALLAKKNALDKADMYKSAKAERVKSPFKREPSLVEIDEYSARLGTKKTGAFGGGIFLSLIGLLLIIAGITTGILITPIMFSITAVGLLLTIVGIIAVIRHKIGKSNVYGIRQTESFIHEIYGDERRFDSALSALASMKAELENYKLQKERESLAERERELFEESTLRAEREVREFIEKFPSTGALTPEEATSEISRRRLRYDMLREYESEKDTERSVCKERIKAHEAALNSFISKFPTKTEDPIGEIRRNLAEYDVLRTSLTRRRQDAERFANAHGITGIPTHFTERINTPLNFSAELSAADEDILSLEREKSRLELDYNTSIREIDKIEELEEKLREKEEQVALYTDNLSVITKAKELLARSKDSMTARYLDSTKHGFEKYMALIDGDNAEFMMDTSFTVTKTDLGKSRQAEAYSRGTRDLHSLAIRLALTDALYEGEVPPIILDDPFISFDDKHIERAVSVMRKLAQSRQIFYFTCSKSRRAK